LTDGAAYLLQIFKLKAISMPKNRYHLTASEFLTNDTPDGLGLTSKSTNGELDAIARGLTTNAASYDPPILADPDEIASELCHWRDKLAAGYIDGSKEPEAEFKWGEWQFKWSHGKRTVEAKDDDDEK
jgi:hypothetical protein|tara:strand:+ start:1762 stop:2145 length:384 start_codon:yes stop_codon:yes gene_type:complete